MLLIVWGLVFGILIGGCYPKSSEQPRTDQRINEAAAVSFEDITARAGISFKHFSGATGKKYMPETVGSGVAFLDYDSDGYPDLLFINSTDWPNAKDRRPHYPKLYHNNKNGTFTDATEKSGLKIDVYGMGVCVGDYDNDGWPDVYFTCIGPNHLFHNEHNGTFRDVTLTAGVAGVPFEPGGIEFKWSSSATFCDYDKDGIPDLFVCNYVHWTPKTDVFCTSRGGSKAYCAPNNYEGVPCTLYKGMGGGKFQDVTAKTGILPHIGKSLGVVVTDLNNDGWPDIAVTNDTSPNFVFVSEHGEKFRETGHESGFAYSDAGRAKAGMGIDAADYQNTGQIGLLTGNFSKECLSLFVNDGTAVFTDQAYPLGVAQPSLEFLTFGLFFFDYDLDGRADIFTANGHIDDYVHQTDAMITYKERPLLFRNLGQRFEEVGLKSGPAMKTEIVGRGCTWGDFDMDGAPDIAIVSNNEGGFLWHNVQSGRHNWVGLKLQGTRSSRDAWGAVIHVKNEGLVQRSEVYGGGSFLSQRQIWSLIGAGHSSTLEKITIDWPSGEHTELSNLPANTYYSIVEGKTEALPVSK